MNNLIAKTELDNRMLKIFSPVVEDMGFEIVRVRLVDGRSKLIQVMVDNSSGTINVDECAKISTELSAIIDLEDPYDDPFNLEVSSPGIDRPLTRLTDFEAWNGYEAKIETVEAIDGQKRFKGILAGINNEEVLITINIGTIGLDFNWISDAKLVLTDDLITKTLNQQNKFNENDFDEIEQEVLN